jgi:hypothetical protein
MTCEGSAAASLVVYQSLTVVSSEADATSLPLGANATAHTQPEWPSSILNIEPLSTSQSLVVMPLETDAIRVPSGDSATSQTQPQWPSSALRITSLPYEHSPAVSCTGGSIGALSSTAGEISGLAEELGGGDPEKTVSVASMNRFNAKNRSVIWDPFSGSMLHWVLEATSASLVSSI